MRRSILLAALALAICFFSCSKDKDIISTDKPLVITTNAIDTCLTIDSLCIETDPIQWVYDISGGFSTTSCIISGNTNATAMSVETYGDGVRDLFEVDLDLNNHFIDTIEVCFLHGVNRYLGCGTRVFLLSNSDDTAQVAVPNPL